MSDGDLGKLRADNTRYYWTRFLSLLGAFWILLGGVFLAAHFAGVVPALALVGPSMLLELAACAVMVTAMIRWNRIDIERSRRRRQTSG